MTQLPKETKEESFWPITWQAECIEKNTLCWQVGEPTDNLTRTTKRQHT